MKLWPLAVLAAGAVPLAQTLRQQEPHTLLLYGRNAGYLSPCGCTQPMAGGLARAASVIRRTERLDKTSVLVVVGGNVSGIGRQSELKAEAAAESTRSLLGFYSFEKEEAALGPGALLEISQLNHENVIASNVQSTSSAPLESSEVGDGFYIGSISLHPRSIADPLGAEIKDIDLAIEDLASRSLSTKCVAVVVTDGSLGEVRELVRKHPTLGVVVYRSEADPPSQPEFEGNTVLVTSGRHGKEVVRLDFDATTFKTYRAIDLQPDVPDDPAVAKVYRRYLQRVAEENLLAQLPRVETGGFAGSKACRSCHEQAFKTWSLSGHAHALADLDKQHHGRDPDCVGCHVVGLVSKQGFTGETKTPQLANVGCESCHGPALQHARTAGQVRLFASKPSACLNCHTPDNSPHFDYKSYWAKIAH